MSVHAMLVVGVCEALDVRPCMCSVSLTARRNTVIVHDLNRVIGRGAVVLTLVEAGVACAKGVCMEMCCLRQDRAKVQQNVSE